jgi:hypothetical protein
MHLETIKHTPAHKPTALASVRHPLIYAPHVSVFRRLIYDWRICKGAKLLWLYLRDRDNSAGQCWPDQRTIANDLRCKTHSLPGWTRQLIRCGYLHTKRVGQRHNFRYTVLTGDGYSNLPKWAARDYRTGNANGSSRRPSRQVVTPKPATPRVACRGVVSNEQGVDNRRAASQRPLCAGRGRLAGNSPAPGPLLADLSDKDFCTKGRELAAALRKAISNQ